MDRVQEWQQFSDHMHAYIRQRTVSKYTAGAMQVDLMGIMGDHTTVVCAFNIVKYAIRMLTGSAKQHDWEKISHYACIGWSNAHDKKEG